MLDTSGAGMQQGTFEALCRDPDYVLHLIPCDHLLVIQIMCSAYEFARA